MEEKNRTILALLIAVVIAVAVLSSFGINFLGSTPEVKLPELTDPVVSTPQGGNEANGYVKVELTPETVQSVIVTLTRPESYRRTVKTELFGVGADPGIVTSEVMVDGGWTWVRTTLTGGQVEYSVVGDGKLYLWRGGEGSYRDFAADSLSADVAQRIPSYEDVLALEKSSITETRYEERGGLPCIYVETYVKELDQYERYWVAVGTCLLVSAETVQNERVIYRMTGYDVVVPATPGTEFALPDGRVLHTAGN